NVVWGSLDSPIEVAPGDLNVPVTITLQYTGTNPLTAIEAYIFLPGGFTSTNGEKVIKVFSTVPGGRIIQLQFSLNLDSKIKLGDYAIAMIINGISGSSIIHTESLTFTLPVKGKVSIDFIPNPYNIKPGQINTVNITLRNSGACKALKLSISFSSSQASIINQTVFDFEELNPNSTKNLVVHLYVSSTFSSTPIYLTASIKYVNEYSYTMMLIKQIQMYVVRPLIPLLTINTSRGELQSGTINIIDLSVKNNGAEAVYDIILTVSTPGGIGLIGSDGKWSLGTIEPGRFKTLNLTLYIPPYQSSSTMQITFSLSYYDSTNNFKTESRTLSFLIAPLIQKSPLTIQVTPSEIYTGITNNVTLRITNNALYDLKNLKITLSSSQAILLDTDNIWSIEKLPSGKYLDISLKLYPQSATITSIQLALSISYYDELNILNQEARSINLLARGLVDLKVTNIAIAPETVVLGQPFSVSVTITNTGTITASGVSATIEQEPWFRIVGRQTVFIGDIQVNVPTSFTMSFIALNITQPTAARTISITQRPINMTRPFNITGSSRSIQPTIKVTLSYMDNLRTRHTQTLEIPITYSTTTMQTYTTRQQTQTTGFPISNVLVLAVAVGISFMVGYLIARRRVK
ncbi:MAG: hypothetical protein QW563_07775, partial [Candidatus Methanomethylicia archaeon]